MLISRTRLAHTLALMLGLTAGAASIAAPISLTTLGTAITQNFDGLSNTTSTTNSLTLPGWSMTESGGGTRDNDRYAADNGAVNTGDTYSYGSAGATDRALGGLLSGNLTPTFGVNFQNNTGSTITSLLVEYIGEQWRLGATGRGADRLDFQYSLNATSLLSGAWTDVDALDFSSPSITTVGALNGNAAANRSALSSTIGLSVANGAKFWLRWTDFDISGSDDGLAVDNFSLTANGAPTAPAAVPEPGSLALALAGLALLGLASQRRKR